MHRGGLTTTPMKRILKKDPADLLRRAIYRMLPKNKQREDRMRRLTVKV